MPNKAVGVPSKPTVYKPGGLPTFGAMVLSVLDSARLTHALPYGGRHFEPTYRRSVYAQVSTLKCLRLLTIDFMDIMSISGA
jgi:hypothetical protein